MILPFSLSKPQTRGTFFVKILFVVYLNPSGTSYSLGLSLFSLLPPPSIVDDAHSWPELALLPHTGYDHQPGTPLLVTTGLVGAERCMG
jgi:hypothetical protein